MFIYLFINLLVLKGDLNGIDPCPGGSYFNLFAIGIKGDALSVSVKIVQAINALTLNYKVRLIPSQRRGSYFQ
jgi:hypothetical protein